MDIIYDEVYSLKTRTKTKKAVNQTGIEFKNNLLIKNLHFSYLNSSKRVLNKINLKIEKGTTIGIIGGFWRGKKHISKHLNWFIKSYQRRNKS